MEQTFWLVEHSTGKKLQVIAAEYLKEASFTRRLNQASTGSVTIETRNAISWREMARPWERIIVCEMEGVVRWAGYVKGYKYDRDTLSLRLDLIDIWDVLENRYPFGVGGGGASALPGYEEGSIAFTGKSWGGAVRAVLIDQTRNGTVGRWNLALDLPADGAGGVPLDAPNYTFSSCAKILEDFAAAEGGPDIDIRPWWDDDGTLKWFVRVSAPRFVNRGIDLVAGLGVGRLVGLSVTVDASRVLTGAWAIGKGSEKEMRVGKAASAVSRPTVFRDSARAFKEIDSVARLNSQAQAEVDTYAYPTEQWDFAYEAYPNAADGPGLRSVWLGDTIGLNISEDPMVGTGYYLRYVIGFSHDLTHRVKVEVQSIGGA